MNTLTTTTREGRPALVTRETGKHGGPAVVIRDEQTGTVLLGVKAEHVTRAVLSSVLPTASLLAVESYLFGGE